MTLRQFISSIGHKWSNAIEAPVVEDEPRQLFVKFMSDGTLDNSQALAFKSKLDGLGVKYDFFDDRKFIIKGSHAKTVLSISNRGGGGIMFKCGDCDLFHHEDAAKVTQHLIEVHNYPVHDAELCAVPVEEKGPEQVIADAIIEHNKIVGAGECTEFKVSHIGTIADALQQISPETFNREVWVNYIRNGGKF